MPSRGLGVATLRSRLGALISLVKVELRHIPPFVSIGWFFGSLALPKEATALPITFHLSPFTSPRALPASRLITGMLNKTNTIYDCYRIVSVVRFAGLQLFNA